MRVLPNPQTPVEPTFWGRFIHRPAALVAIVYLVGIVVASFGAGLIAPYSAISADFTAVLTGPTSAHLLGTDTLGRDILSRLLFGGRITLQGVGEALGAFLLVGTTLGLLAAERGGWVDWLVTRIADVFFSIPLIIVLLVVYGVFPGNQDLVMVTFGVLSAPGLIRVVRAGTLAVKSELYIDAARVSGLGTVRILWRHVVPRISGAIIVQATIFASIALLVECGLTFLGLGVEPPAPSWGGLVGDASDVITRQPWMLVPTGGIIVITILAFALLGAAVRGASVETWTASAGSGRRRVTRTRTEAESPPDDGSTDPGGEALLSVRGLSVAFAGKTGDTQVADNVSFTVGAGEIVGFVGESGCGKTVTMLAILGVLPQGGQITSGRCLLESINLTALTRRQLRTIRGRRLAYISQEPMVALDPMRRAGAQVAEAVRQHQQVSRRVARERTLDLFSEVRLADPAGAYDRYPHELSGGMAQRISIAFALAGEPDLLIADEPTTALDVTVQAEILRLLQTLQAERSMSVILVTHDFGVVAAVCQRAVVMYAGQVVELATVDDLYSQPLHPYTRGLLMSNPHGVLPSDELPTIPGTVPAPGEWPSGCRFHPRCAQAREDCALAPVALREFGERRSRCLYAEDLITPNHG